VPEAVHKECVIEGMDREDAKKIENADWIKVEMIRDENSKVLMIKFLRVPRIKTKKSIHYFKSVSISVNLCQ
jgi:hypothetical protein